ncbi:MAG: ParM/StbA family protein [Lachnospiraceae bacterium]|nr:ParM/StbA family protein [Lachnospiraceae bacterium]
MAQFIIGVDVGYGNTKTAHNCFSSGAKKLPGKPPLSTMVVETTEGYYAIGNGKVSIQKSKTEDEYMRVLTMAAIAEELKRNKVTIADVHLGVGVPLTRMGAEKDEFINYYNKNRRLIFKYEDVQYSVTLSSVNVFPQGYAGVVSLMPTFRMPSLVIDIGSWTVDILPLVELKPDMQRVKSLPLGTITCINEINEALRQRLGSDADESIIKNVMINGSADIPDSYLSIIQTGLSSYVTNLMDQIRALGFNPDLTQFVYIGGGATIMKHFLSQENIKNALILDDVNINAKGYEDLIRHKLGGKS